MKYIVVICLLTMVYIAMTSVSSHRFDKILSVTEVNSDTNRGFTPGVNSFHHEDFENTRLTKTSQPFNISGTHAPTISTDYSHSGTRSVRSMVTTGGDNRSEIRHKGGYGTPTVIDWKHPYNSVRSFVWWVYVPSGYQASTVKHFIMQWKNLADPGCDVGSPPFAIVEHNGKWEYVKKHDGDTACTVTVETTFGDIDGTITSGWHHFAVELYYNYTASGYFKLWYRENDTINVDTDLLYHERGPTGYNDRQGPYFKLGNYGAPNRTLYFDDVTIIEGPYGIKVNSDEQN